jgi:transposase
VIQIPANAHIFVMHEPVNFHNGIDGTAAIARVVLEKEPMDGAFFVFRNRRGHMLRILYYDGGGYWLCTKRLSKGCFSAWPRGEGTGTSHCSPLLVRELQILLWGGDPESCSFPELWRQVA